MPYRFKASEPVADGVRRIVLEEIDSAVDLLTHATARKRDEAVHEARKSIKRIRGLLRLVGPELGKKFRLENARFRNVGHSLSALRDAAALLETVDNIEQRHRTAIERRMLGPIRSGLQASKRRLEQQFVRSETIAHAASALRTAATRVSSWPLRGDGFKTIAAGLKLTYRRGRYALQEAEKNRDALSCHTLRKRVKDHWYHIRLLESIWTEVAQAYEGTLKELETWLGEDHNVAVLHAQLEESPESFGGKENVLVFLAVAGEYQKDLRKKALSLAARVYAEKPRLLVDRVAALWHEWEGQPIAMEEAGREWRGTETQPAGQVERRLITV